MDRSPLVLAALASAAVPGLDPVTVEALPTRSGDRFDCAIVRDTEHRHWVVRAPRSETAAAALDGAVPLLTLLSRRLSIAVPAPKGFVALPEGGRACVHPLLPGHALDFTQLPAGPGLATELGRALAAVHNLDPALYDEAGLPTYDADAYRARRLADLDRGAATGRVPIGLLARWEKALENVGLWRFPTTPVHGSLTGDHVLAVFDDDEDAATGRVRGLLAWEGAEVADPAQDFAALVNEATPAAVDSVLESYAHSRVERPDANLLVRARLLAELALLRDLMDAQARRDKVATEALTGRLRRLDDHLHSLEERSDDYKRLSLTPTGLPTRPTRTEVTAPIPIGLARSVAADPVEQPTEPQTNQATEQPTEQPTNQTTEQSDHPAADQAAGQRVNRTADRTAVRPTADRDSAEEGVWGGARGLNPGNPVNPELDPRSPELDSTTTDPATEQLPLRRDLRRSGRRD